MVFSSIDFLFIFLPFFLLSYSLIPARNLVFVVFSLFFYFVGEGYYTAVVLASVCANYVLGVRIASSQGRARKKYLALAVALNLLALIFFKYAVFIAADILESRSLVAALGDVHLPLGISFFTFHALSYLIDVYRKDAYIEKSLPNLGLYILMFPQLIAGPILRYSKIAPQLTVRSVTGSHVYYGLLYFLFGLGAKVLIADTMAGVADPLFKNWSTLSSMQAWVAALSYTFQIYFDFGGYSAMAIGLALMCGFDFPQNFNFPYMSRSITEFWRRWHITLSSWFRDYLYIPLGGNQHGAIKTYRNLFIVFLLCGLWHGAAWTFIIWGLYHGLLLVLERMGFSKVLAKSPQLLQHFYAMLAVVVGWVMFRASSFHEAAGIIGKMFAIRSNESVPLAQILNNEEMIVFIVATLFSTPLFIHFCNRWVSLPIPRPWPSDVAISAKVMGMSLALFVFGFSLLKIYTGSYSPFIYFRF